MANRIDARFEQVRKAKRTALMPYLPLGFPTLDASAQLIRAAEKAGADAIELGVPFSDPLADGPVIQHATQIALRNGMTVQKCLEMVQDARGSGVSIPLMLMSYYNPLLRFGIQSFVRTAKEVGADGFIVPDLPPEEADELAEAAHSRELALTFLVAPTSTPDRLRKIAEASQGFLYLVSVTGVTGARDRMADGLPEFAARLRKLTGKPICVGFGIANAATARQVAGFADGVIVGSALVSRIGEPADAVDGATRLLSELREAV